LKDLLDKEKAIYLPMILNPKTLDPRDDKSPRVYQVETAMGAAISLFEGATALVVPRTRFFPVKKCDDLLAVRSDLFELTDTGDLLINPEREKKGLPDSIQIRLDPNYYGKIDLFNDRFDAGVPSLIDCEGLTIDGDVRFEKNVSISGHVTINNGRSSQAVIKQGSVIKDDLMF
jgi:UTP--glucose-1-phosphate uridylyltransferase